MQILEFLQSTDSLNRRRARDYVLEALYLGAELVEGTAEYESFLGSVYADVYGEVEDSDRPLTAEAADYLKEILQAAAGGSIGPLSGLADFDGFSGGAYEEVSSLLGREGRSYLGVSGPIHSLVPSRSLADAFVNDEETARLNAYAARAPDTSTPVWDDPYPYPWEPLELRAPVWRSEQDL